MIKEEIILYLIKIWKNKLINLESNHLNKIY